MLRSGIRGVHQRASASDHPCASEHRKQVRELLAALAEIDHAYEVDLETVRTSDAPIAIKQTVIDTLRQQHQERRAPYLRKLEAARRKRIGEVKIGSLWSIR
jgi:hypothetical protein